jgi:hypothetical protein
MTVYVRARQDRVDGRKRFVPWRLKLELTPTLHSILFVK